MQHSENHGDIDNAPGDGSETFQFAVNESDTFDAWDYDDETTTVEYENTEAFQLGQQAAGFTSYYDEFRCFHGTTMPIQWLD